MKTQKGYILPIILIVMLLGLAGYFLFASKPVESPVVDNTPVIATTTATTTEVEDVQDSDIETTEVEEDTATTTASTTIDISLDSEIEIIE